jgi:glycosyltransferase involved in cell wall biosynthesis
MEFSLIIPFYNSEQTIERCIQGLLCQTYPNDRFEMIFIDNNSQDASRDIVERYSQVQLLDERVQGVYAARNRGIEAASGMFIAFTDADCVPHPDWLRRVKDAMQNPGVHVVVGPSQLAGSSPFVKLLDTYERYKERYILSHEDPSVYWGHASNMAVRRETWNACGPFIEIARGADVLFVRRVVDSLSCDAVIYEPRARVLHLEVAGLVDYFKKVFVYGASHQNYGRIIKARALRNSERVAILKCISRQEPLSTLRLGTLALLLLFGLACWYSGATTTRVRRLTNHFEPM